jgi:hypothetical protein
VIWSALVLLFFFLLLFLILIDIELDGTLFALCFFVLIFSFEQSFHLLSCLLSHIARINAVLVHLLAGIVTNNSHSTGSCRR